MSMTNMSVTLLLVALTFDLYASDLAADGASDYSIYTEPQRLVEVAPGRHINLVCLGEGSPTVIFDIGVGDPAGDWSLVQPQVAEFTRACSYDRAGLGFSDPGDGGGSSGEIVADMKRLLSAASIAPPYILVGQSYGGMNVRLYYYTHPEEVVGLVLVEPSHEEQDEGFRMLSLRALSRADWVAGREPGRLARERCIERARQGAQETDARFREECVVDPPVRLPDAIKPMWFRAQFSEQFQRTQGAEERAVFAESVEQLRRSRRGFGDLPVVVLSRSPEERPLREWETRHLRDARYRFWLDLHRGLADSSSRGDHRVVPESDHLLMLSQPDAVVQAIRDIFETVSERRTDDLH
jgi:pimeloyl-ACP methyl ester carboxylesterase